MGAWGTGVFSDDIACDVRDGFTGIEATQKLLPEWSTALEDPDDGPVFWLALTAIQWKKGRLEEFVLQRALAIIDKGADLSRWDANSRDYGKRKGVLEKLRAQLTSSQPPQKRIPKRFRDSNTWSVGDLVSYRLVSGRLVIFRVIRYHSDKGGTALVCELLDWVGNEMPKNLAALGV